MNEELRTYILENMDAGTVIAFPEKDEKEKKRRMRNARMMAMKSMPIEGLVSAKVSSNALKKRRKKDEDEDLELGNICASEEMKESIFGRAETFIPGMSLDEYIDGHLPNYNVFQTLLFKMIDERGLKDSDVYNKVGMSRKTFSKIRTLEDYHPSRETVILLGLSLELSISEMEELLDSAAYSLPRNNAADLIIRFACQSKIYNVMEVNEMLDEYGCKLLGE